MVEKKKYNYYADPEYLKKHYEYLKQKVKCDCGGKTTRGHLTTHKKSVKHMKWLEENKDKRDKYKEELEIIKDKMVKYKDRQKYLREKLRFLS